MNDRREVETKGCRYSVVQYVVLKVRKKIKIVLAKIKKV